MHPGVEKQLGIAIIPDRSIKRPHAISSAWLMKSNQTSIREKVNTKSDEALQRRPLLIDLFMELPKSSGYFYI
jgi:hypothetical protein